MDDELKSLATSAAKNVFVKAVGMGFWSVVGPFAVYYFGIGIFDKVVPGLLWAGWFVEESLVPPPFPPSVYLAVSIANLVIYTFVIQVVLYEFYIHTKDNTGIWEGVRVHIMMYLVADMFIINQVGLTRERLMTFLAIWLILVFAAAVILGYIAMFSKPYEHRG